VIKVVTVQNSVHYLTDPDEANECIVLRRCSRDSNSIEMAFPFQPDTSVIQLSIVDAIMLRNALDELVSVKFLEKTGGPTE
jgi:hypothetical protein